MNTIASIKRRTRPGWIAALLALPLSGQAQSWLDQPALSPLEKGSFYAKFGVSRFDPSSSSGPLTFEEDTRVPILGTVLPAGPVAGSGIAVAPDEIATITLGYLLTSHLSIETALGLPTLKFDNVGRGSLEDAPLVRIRIPRLTNVQVGPLDGKLADVTAAPLNAKLIYHFRPDRRVRPYLGAGATYTITYNERLVDPSLWTRRTDPATAPDLEVSDEWGSILQAGVDIDLTDKWFLGIDVMRVDLDFDNRITNVVTDGGVVGEVRGSDAKVKVEADPYIYTLSLGRVF
ncbi:MAG: OmpW family outer membrane protein [Pseudomonadota bacterium]|nr:OmpW family outer membrane protein [Pseudomonadota bacterium]